MFVYRKRDIPPGETDVRSWRTAAAESAAAQLTRVIESYLYYLLLLLLSLLCIAVRQTPAGPPK